LAGNSTSEGTGTASVPSACFAPRTMGNSVVVVAAAAAAAVVRLPSRPPVRRLFRVCARPAFVRSAVCRVRFYVDRARPGHTLVAPRRTHGSVGPNHTRISRARRPVPVPVPSTRHGHRWSGRGAITRRPSDDITRLAYRTRSESGPRVPAAGRLPAPSIPRVP